MTAVHESSPRRAAARVRFGLPLLVGILSLGAGFYWLNRPALEGDRSLAPAWRKATGSEPVTPRPRTVHASPAETPSVAEVAVIDPAHGSGAVDDVVALEQRLEGEELLLENRRQAKARLARVSSTGGALSDRDRAVLSARERALDERLALQVERVEALEERLAAAEERSLVSPVGSPSEERP